MIDSEYGFHNENDYSESYREMKDEKSVVYGSAAKELIRFYNRLTY